MKDDNKRPVALITNASKGIGLELAKVFAEKHYNLIINSSSEDLNESASDLRNMGAEVTSVIADLSTREGADLLYNRAKEAGEIDVLVLNAVMGAGGEFINSNFEDEFKVMNLNMVYLVYLTKLFLRDMIVNDEGKILFTSSVTAEAPAPYHAVYAASKTFVHSFSHALRRELEETHKKVSVTSLQPGLTDTDFFERVRLLKTMVGEEKKDDPAQVAREGYKALMEGKDHVVSGIKNKIQVAVSKLATEALKARAHGKLSKTDELKH
jgi:uncharacterized protein